LIQWCGAHVALVIDRYGVVPSSTFAESSRVTRLAPVAGKEA
jgi:hypothetical protein